jgi:hypothetical protein
LQYDDFPRWSSTRLGYDLAQLKARAILIWTI